MMVGGMIFICGSAPVLRGFKAFYAVPGVLMYRYPRMLSDDDKIPGTAFRVEQWHIVPQITEVILLVVRCRGHLM